MATSALAGKVGGLCIEGCIHDSKETIDSGFPVFARGFCIRGTAKGTLGVITTHGTYLLMPVLKRVKAGQFILPTNLKVIMDSGAVVIVDGGDGLGAVAGKMAVEMVVETITGNYYKNYNTADDSNMVNN